MKNIQQIAEAIEKIQDDSIAGMCQELQDHGLDSEGIASVACDLFTTIQINSRYVYDLLYTNLGNTGPVLVKTLPDEDLSTQAELKELRIKHRHLNDAVAHTTDAFRKEVQKVKDLQSNAVRLADERDELSKKCIMLEQKLIDQTI